MHWEGDQPEALVVAWTKFISPRAPEQMDPYSRGMNPHPHVPPQLNISTNQIRRKMYTEKFALLLHPSVFKPFAFHMPALVLETAINCPHPTSLDNYS